MSDNAAADAAPGRQTKRGGVDLDGMTVQELTALRDAAEAKRREKLEEAKNAVLERARAELAALGLSLESIIPAAASTGQGKRSRKDAGDKLPVKYRGPNGEEWSGRGRLPKWLQTMEAKGQRREEFKT